MNGLDRFEAELTARIDRPTNLRPFVCEGSPLKCQAFIVGFNPATEMTEDFWGFWRAGYGFDKARWLTEYVHERKSRPLRPGKTRRSAVSPTRRVIEWILEEAAPIHVLETNIYATATNAARELDAARRKTAPLDFFVAEIKPRVIVVHGKDAEAHIQSKYLGIPMIPVAHFSRGWSQAAARALGQQIRHACQM
jgi:hypothetical protein